MTVKVQFTLFALLSSLLSARADLVMEQQSSDTNVTYHVTLKLHGDKMRMDQRDDKSHAFSVIVDLSTRDSITLLPQEKMFLKRSGKDIRLDMELEEQASHGTNAMDRAPAPAVDTGKTAVVDGYATEIYTWSGADGLTETLWVATNFPDYDAIRPELAKLDRFDNSGPHRNAQPELSRLPGMVVQTEKTVNGQKVIVTLVLAKAEPVDAALFELPASYSLWKPPPPRVTVNPAAPKK
jgi:Domain of unknown function (DUF4412)